MKKKGITPLVTALVSGVASGLLSKKKDRDGATPKGAGTVRDIGITAAGVASASMALQANGVIDCTTYGLEQTFCNAAHGLLLIAGFVMYWIGISKNKSKTESDE